MIDPNHEAFVAGKIVAICQCILKVEIGIIAGSRRLVRLGLELFGKHDDDFTLFRAIDSETDHFPVDCERTNWSQEALSEKDKEIKDVEKFHREDVEAACHLLISRFDQH